MENNKKIENLVQEFRERVSKNIIENTAWETIGETGGVNCQYEIEEDLNKFLFKLGEILGNIDLKKIYKYSRTIEEIVEEIKISKEYLKNFEELELIEKTIDANDAPKYIYNTYIVKHIPSGKFYSFMKKNDEPIEFIGEVISKEIIKIEWVSKI